MKNILLDGRSLKPAIFGGTQRYTEEILKELDKLVTDGSYYLVVYDDCRTLDCLKNIKIIYIPRTKKNKKFNALDNILKLTNSIYVGFVNNLARDKDSITTIHDIYAFYGLYSRIPALKLKIKALINARKAATIVTVSEYSKQTMLEKLPIKDPDRIKVIYNANARGSGSGF